LIEWLNVSEAASGRHDSTAENPGEARCFAENPMETPDLPPLPLPRPLETLVESEMEEARSIQQAMLPREPLRLPRAELTYKSRQAAEVGGDFLDYFALTERHLVFYLGDVVGKGLPAALYAALVVGILRGIKKGEEPPTSVLSLLNNRLLDRKVLRRHCGVQYALFDTASRELCFCHAGLLPRPLRVSAAGCQEIGEGGLPCGLFPDAHYNLYAVRLEAGDCVLFFTDGVTEAMNAASEEFGMNRLIEVCTANRTAPAETILARIFEAVDDFAAGAPQHDDMTAAVLKLL
jgi:sigma-B regulation protein RsbU (phosphoserine phosphatase)